MARPCGFHQYDLYTWVSNGTAVDAQKDKFLIIEAILGEISHKRPFLKLPKSYDLCTRTRRNAPDFQNISELVKMIVNKLWNLSLLRVVNLNCTT